MTDLIQLERHLLARIAEADERALEDVRVTALGKKGAITELLKSLGTMSPDERKDKGPQLNGLRDRITAAIAARKTQLDDRVMNERLATERVDVTLPVDVERGTIHPVSQVLDEITAIFADLGFAVAEGPDIEYDDYNFTKLNIPPAHPARQMHDTFYLKPQADGSRHLLRTHTSPVQVRTMLKQKPPIRIIAPGRSYRHDSDATHSPMFHQVEALVIDEETHLGHLRWLIEEFCKAFFEIPNVRMRFRPSYFPFTEPSMEVDIGCDRSGNRIKIGDGNDWLELGGSGMVHPHVLELCGIDPARYQG
ncbi:MAG: phenylalanine--tRNA ligase subunit alpha, partial [Rhizomicrobium sp.]